MNSNINKLLADLYLLKSNKKEYKPTDYIFELVKKRKSLLHEVQEIPITNNQNKLLKEEFSTLF